MARSADAAIPGTENLYRSVSKAHVWEHGVFASAVEMPACSFNRGAHSEPEDVLVPSRPEDNGILVVTPDELPPPVPRASGEPYEFFAADDPYEGSDAHCEIRIRRVSLAYSSTHKPSKDVRAKAKAELAKRLRVHRQPV